MATDGGCSNDVMWFHDLINDLLKSADSVRQQQRAGKPLAPEDIKILKAELFLQQIAPYLFDETRGHGESL